MNDNIILFLNFNEVNFDTENNKLSGLYNYCQEHNIDLSLKKALPPCFGISEIPVNIKKPYLLSRTHKMITHNLFFGEEHIEKNKLFFHNVENSFVRKSCKNCSYHENYLCRGIPGKSFYETRIQLIDKFSSKGYKSIARDYSNGNFVTGSRCQNHCVFCYDKCIPDNILYRAPELTINEIKHFLYYLTNTEGGIVGFNKYCANGEISCHPDKERILMTLAPFLHSIYTNGTNLTEGFIKLISTYNLNAIISVHSINDKIREQFMKIKTTIPIKETLALLDKYKIPYTALAILLKTNILSKDLTETITYLENSTEANNLILQPLIVSDYLVATKDGEALIYEAENTNKNFIPPLKRIQRIQDNAFVFDKMLNNTHFKISKLEKDIKILSELHKSQKSLLISPEYSTASFIPNEIKNLTVLDTESSFLFNYPSADLVSFPLITTKIKELNQSPELIILSAQNLSTDLEDFSQNEINHLWTETKAPIAIIN